MLKFTVLVLGIFLGLLLIFELILRSFFGLGNPLIYVADPQIGYLLGPNQRVRRFGRRIEINQYSMRSAAVTPDPGPDSLRFLLLGDSVVNGGWWTDQSQTISALITYLYNGKLVENTRLNLEILNISANSWGPRNVLAYLKKYGLFGARGAILLINTDDLFAGIPNSLVVGIDRNYPDHKPLLAIGELLDRYVLPPRRVKELEIRPKETGDIVGKNLDAIQKIKNLVVENQGNFILGMTPLKRELEGMRSYEKEARSRLDQFVAQEGIIYIDFLAIFQQITSPETLYRDHIHLSPQGNQIVSKTLGENLQ